MNVLEYKVINNTGINGQDTELWIKFDLCNGWPWDIKLERQEYFIITNLY